MKREALRFQRAHFGFFVRSSPLTKARTVFPKLPRSSSQRNLVQTHQDDEKFDILNDTRKLQQGIFGRFCPQYLSRDVTSTSVYSELKVNLKLKTLS